MLRREDAYKMLQREQTPNWEARCLAAIADELSEDLRPVAFALLGRDADGKSMSRTSQEAIRRHQEAIERGYARLTALTPGQRLRVFATLFPRVAPAVEAAWRLLARLPYQSGLHRRAFRAPGDDDASFGARRGWLGGIITQLACYRDKDLPWFAAWAPYLGGFGYGGHGGQPFGILFAAAIDAGGACGEAIFDTLVASARGEHPIGAMGRHVTTGLLTAARPDGWACIEGLLLAAQREEGLRQVILETVDEAHPQAFRRMVRLILDHDLIRFSAAVRAADVWLGFGWQVDDARAVRDALCRALCLLDDERARRDSIAHGNPQQTYLALWATAFEDASEAITAAAPALADAMPERRLGAAHLVGQLRLPAAHEVLLALLDDPDLRVALCAFDGLAQWAAVLAGTDLFERVERLLARLGGKEKTIPSGVWPWLTVDACETTLTRALADSLGQRDPTRLIAYVRRMDGAVRVQTAEKLAALPEWDEAVRGVLFGLAGDRGSWVRDRALALIAQRPLAGDGIAALEALLARKSSELRRSLLSLLLKQDDDVVVASAGRLLAAPHALQHLAGLNLLRGLAEAGRAVEPCREAARAYRTAHEAPTSEETVLLDTILATGRDDGAASAVAPTADSVLGLIDPAERTAPISPRRVDIEVSTPAARACLLQLDALIEDHRATPVRIKTWRGGDEALLGNLGWQFPQPNATVPPDEDALANLPLVEVWRRWERGRGADLRDPDGLELFRALLLLQGTRALLTPHNADDASMASQTKPGIAEPCTYPDRLRLQYRGIVGGVLDWLVHLRGGATGQLLDFLLDTAETALANVPTAALEHEKTVTEHLKVPLRHELQRDASLARLERYRERYPAVWTDAHAVRYWRLLHWLDQPLPGLSRLQPPLPVVLDAHRAGDATEADLLDHLGAATEQRYSYWNRGANGLHMLSGRAPHPLLAQYPVLQRLLPALRERIVEVELARGEMPTAATRLAFALRYSGGTDVFVRLVASLLSVDFARGYMYDGESRATSLSHLLRVTFPGPDDSYDEFARRVRAAGIDEQRLVAAAVYAPQWARYVERCLDWPYLEDAIWWTHAHTNDSNWSVDQNIREVWEAQMAERTPLAARDLLDGAVDVAWFWRSYQRLGPQRWEQVYAAAKYASAGTGHGRARLFADAMTGKATAAELRQCLFAKRQQDVVRALGLVPLPADADAREAEVAGRYEAVQEFLRTGRQFGSQRRASEGAAARIGLENLARTAGYPDPIRLQWAMEARLSADLRDGPLTAAEDGVTVALALDAGTGAPCLTIARADGKVLKSLPARLKKNAAIGALVERKREVERQVARMRGSLEGAMCRGDLFTAAEIVQLLQHPVLSRLLCNLIFVQDGDEPGAVTRVLGYPAVQRSDDGPAVQGSDDGPAVQRSDGGPAQGCIFRAHDGSLARVDPAAANLRLAHPCDLLASGAWHDWQHECFVAERIQPFKQVFRELYVRTEGETRHGDEAMSYRYSGHQVQPRQALALLGARGWVAYQDEGARRTFHAEGLSASLSFEQGVFTPAEVEGLTVDGVCFTRRGEWKPLPLASVPPRVFSEVMRDLDLVVSVAHSGGVDPEATASTVEMRSALVTETCTLLGLSNVTTRSAHALIDGKLGSYSVHLGSAVAHRQPGGALCIVPVHAQQRGRIFLPFADDDPKTAEVISKILLLARDAEIKDPSVLEQIL